MENCFLQTGLPLAPVCTVTTHQISMHKDIIKEKERANQKAKVVKARKEKAKAAKVRKEKAKERKDSKEESKQSQCLAGKKAGVKKAGTLGKKVGKMTDGI